MTEDEARALLRAWGGDGFETWVADRPWHLTRGGWKIDGTLLGWQVTIEPVPPRLRLHAFTTERRSAGDMDGRALSHTSAGG
jgi:hypothetical protein